MFKVTIKISMRNFIYTLLFCFIATSAFSQDYTRYADPFVGTGGHGHTFPGAVMPFGMIQLSPDTRLRGWDGCSGYHYSDTIIYGFSHTHLSGTGCLDYGDVLLMPTMGKVRFGHKNYSSSFSHSNETATPGYYAVLLNKHHIKAELTATKRTGLHKYTFPKSDHSNIILDLNHRDWVRSAEISINGDREITGHRYSSSWADKQHIYFVIQFSKPFKKAGISKGGVVSQSRHAKGLLLRSFVSFETTDGEVIYARVGISAVSVEGARKNLEAEQPGWDFDKVRTDARNDWNKELGKVAVESSDTSVMRTFYSSMYHVMTSPYLYQDVDGKYRGQDQKIHEGKGYEQYTVFSIWDTYRALHPLLTLIDRKRTGDFINSFLSQYEQGGLLPVWELAGCETNCMTGYHSVSVINDAFQKGIANFNAAEALEAMKKSATSTKKQIFHYRKGKSFSQLFSLYSYTAGWDDYGKYGYIRYKSGIQSVSKTLEYAYDDWCIAQMAKKLNKTEDYNFYIKRALNYKNLLDTVTGFMRAKQKVFERRFDPYAVTLRYTEGNAWQYSFYVPQDISGQMKMLGSRERLATMLDSLFNTSSVLHGRKVPDVTGLVGQYAHGNEPSHQIAYEYNYTGQPWKTQSRVRNIMTTMYRDQPNGLEGNDDCGQMSAWYVFSAIGFYPVCPGSDEYVIGSPVVDKAVMHFENGKSFTVRVVNNSKSNIYIASAKLNGANYSRSYLKYDDIAKGGELEFTMSDTPNKDWGSSEGGIPVSKIEP
jgi:predicted alpha-1,2-mannosidase